MALRIYPDTSVFGGCLDADFAEWSNRLMEDFSAGVRIAVVSDLTLKEIQAAPVSVRSVLDRIPDQHREYVSLDDEAKDLARLYIKHDAVAEKQLVDAQHIAIATVHSVSVLVSWNFRHIVNLTRIRLYNSVNLKYGYPLLEIRSPREVVREG